jgi:hypothetical protein
MTAVLTPALAACSAAMCPAVPPPATTTSTVSLMHFIAQALTWQSQNQIE